MCFRTRLSNYAVAKCMINLGDASRLKDRFPKGLVSDVAKGFNLDSLE